MPITSRWDPDDSIWTITVVGTFTIEQITEVVEKIEWNEATRYLWDLRDSGSGPNRTRDLRELVDSVARDREKYRGRRVAIVVGHDFKFGIARMFQSRADGLGVEFEVVRDVETARTWLKSTPTAPG